MKQIVFQFQVPLFKFLLFNLGSITYVYLSVVDAKYRRGEISEEVGAIMWLGYGSVV